MVFQLPVYQYTSNTDVKHLDAIMRIRPSYLANDKDVFRLNFNGLI